MTIFQSTRNSRKTLEWLFSVRFPQNLFFVCLFLSVYHIIHFKYDVSHADFITELFEDRDIKLLTLSKMCFYFSKQILPYKLF